MGTQLEPCWPSRDISAGVPTPGCLAVARGATPFPAGRFLSVEECQALFQRVLSYGTSDRHTQLRIESKWAGNLRWARNGILSSGDTRNNTVNLSRGLVNDGGDSVTNVLDDRHLRWLVARAERASGLRHQVPDALRGEPSVYEEYLKPKLWYDSTYHQDAAQRAELMQRLVQPAQAAGMLSAGYLEVSATGQAMINGEQLWYYPYTKAQYSVTVRVPDGSGSGWAGQDHNDWTKIDAEKLSAIALEKCLRSRNPVRLEPGRYTTILEPQAVGDIVAVLYGAVTMNRSNAEGGDPKILKSDPRYKKDPQGVYNDAPGYSKLGEKVIDERLTVRSDCTDPDLGYPPFQVFTWAVFPPVTWIENGILKELAYGRGYAVQKLHRNTSQIASGAFRMNVTGEMVSVDEMIATTKRGLLVTRLYGVHPVPGGEASAIQSGYTRDGLWLIENGKISKPVKNFRFTESPVFVLNNIEQLGVPQRIFSPGNPIIVPPMKVRDFSFTSLSDAI